MERYPLRVTIPRAEAKRGRMFMHSHMEFVIIIDDCGKAYPERYRRYKTFLWLHGQLKRQQLSCALPELPPKKAVGNMEECFVETRRQMLETYLQALLRVPEVIQNDRIWVFLDADRATAAVPRFLCRPESSAKSAECLLYLKQVAEQREGDDLFRLCNAAVTAALTDFVREEAHESIPIRIGQQQDTRLHIRLRLCAVLHALLKSERAEVAKSGLVATGLFGALLALLGRSTEDSEIARASFQNESREASYAALAESARAARDFHNSVSDQVTACLTVLIEQTKGTALVSFCQQDGGLEGLRRLAETERLHLAAASMLWHGMQHHGVVLALTSKAAGGFTLLGKLMDSHDLKARIMAALCIGCVVRSEVDLLFEDRQACFERIAQTQILATLDHEERSAVRRGAERALVSGLLVGEVASTADSETNPFAPQADRDKKLASVLQWLCRRDGVPSLRPLLGGTGGNAGDGFDAVSMLVVAILDHFTQHFSGDAERLCALSDLEDQLRRIVDAPEPEASFDEAGMEHSPAAVEREVTRIRAARVLVRLWSSRGDAAVASSSAPAASGANGAGAGAGAAPAGEPLALELCASRARALDVLIRYSEYRQEESIRGLHETHSRGEEQFSRVEAGKLREPPCVPEQRFNAFARQVGRLAEARKELSREMDAAHRAQEATVASLDQRGVQHMSFKGDVGLLTTELGAQAQAEHEAQEAQQAALRAEAEASAAADEVSKGKAELQAAEADGKRLAEAAREAEGRAEALCARQQDCAAVRHTAPADLERARRDADCAQAELQAVAGRVAEVSAELERTERRVRALRAGEREAEAALVCTAEVKSRLEGMKASLSSETVLSEREREQLQDMEQLFQPARPARIMRRTSFAEEDLHDGVDGSLSVAAASSSSSAAAPGSFALVGDAAAPSWEEDLRLEKDFREEPHVRSFAALRDARERLWQKERAWLQDAAAVEDRHTSEAQETLQGIREEERTLQDLQARFRLRIEYLADQAGHEQRHAEACCEAEQARAEADRITFEVGEAEANFAKLRLHLDRVEEAYRQAEAERAGASEAASAAMQRSRRARAAIQKRSRELEEVAHQQLKDWQLLELHRTRVELLQDRVQGQIATEADGRAKLREQVSLLIQELHELDYQLQISPFCVGGEFATPREAPAQVSSLHSPLHDGAAAAAAITDAGHTVSTAECEYPAGAVPGPFASSVPRSPGAAAATLAAWG